MGKLSKLFAFLSICTNFDNIGCASEKQIEQALCFSLGLHYIWIILAAVRNNNFKQV